MTQNGLMPSYEAACDLYRGDPTAITRVGLGVATRSLVIGLGLMAAGMRGRDVVKYGVAGSLAVEAFVLWWVWANRPKKQGEEK